MYLRLFIAGLILQQSRCNVISTNVTAAAQPGIWDSNVQTTLRDLGDMAVKMVDSLTKSGDTDEVDLDAITEMISALSRAAVLVNHPQEMLKQDVSTELEAFKQEVNGKIGRLERENEELRSTVERKIQQNKKQENTLTMPGFLTAQKHREFRAFATSKQTLSSGTKVKFHKVVKNDLPGYDPAFGFFTCPYSGSYFISVSIKPSAIQKNQVSVNVKMGNSVILFSVGASSVYYSSVYQWNMGSGSVITHCSQGERIYVESKGSGSVDGGAAYYGTMFHVYHIN